MDLQLVAGILRHLNLRVRAVPRGVVVWNSQEAWSTWMAVPAPGYLELEAVGPMRITEVDSLLVDPVEAQHHRFVSTRVDHSEALARALQREGVGFSIADDGLFSVSLSEGRCRCSSS